MASLVAQTVKHLPTMQETWVQSLGQEDLLEKEMAVFLEKYLLYLLEKGIAIFLGSFPGSGRSLGEGNFQYSCLEYPMDGGTWLGYSPWGHKELDTTEQLHSLTHSNIVA